EGAVDAGVARAENFFPGQVRQSVARRMRVSEKQKLDPMLTVVQHQLFVEDEAGDLEVALGDVLPTGESLAGLSKFLRSLNSEEPGTVSLGDDARARLAEDRVAIGMIAVMMGVQDISNRLVCRLSDRLDDVGCFLRKRGVDDDDVVLEDDPGIVAAAKL